ncbi:MAG: glyoxalase [Chloroflexi bacterium]|nr:MAG: glyoxalase [Chloroflexota bacterium]
MRVLGLDHVQLPIRPGGEELAREFWHGLLGLDEVAKPSSLAARGGVWFQCGPQQIHCGVEAEFTPGRRHPALLVEDLAAVRAALSKAGRPVREEPEIPGYRRLFTDDPFGNRIELMELL